MEVAAMTNRRPRHPRRAVLLAGLRDLVARCPEERAPLALVAGPEAYALPALHWAATQLGLPVRSCLPQCPAPTEVLLLTKRVASGRSTSTEKA
jgi:hypothetical protein